MRKKTNIFKRLGYHFLIIVLLFNSLPIQSVMADDVNDKVEEIKFEEISDVELVEEYSQEESLVEEVLTQEALTEEALTEEASQVESLVEEVLTQEALTEEALTEATISDDIVADIEAAKDDDENFDDQISLLANDWDGQTIDISGYDVNTYSRLKKTENDQLKAVTTIDITADKNTVQGLTFEYSINDDIYSVFMSENTNTQSVTFEHDLDVTSTVSVSLKGVDLNENEIDWTKSDIDATVRLSDHWLLNNGNVISLSLVNSSYDAANNKNLFKFEVLLNGESKSELAPYIKYRLFRVENGAELGTDIDSSLYNGKNTFEYSGDAGTVYKLYADVDCWTMSNDEYINEIISENTVCSDANVEDYFDVKVEQTSKKLVAVDKGSKKDRGVQLVYKASLVDVNKVSSNVDVKLILKTDNNGQTQENSLTSGVIQNGVTETTLTTVFDENKQGELWVKYTKNGSVIEKKISDLAVVIPQEYYMPSDASVAVNAVITQKEDWLDSRDVTFSFSINNDNTELNKNKKLSVSYEDKHSYFSFFVKRGAVEIPNGGSVTDSKNFVVDDQYTMTMTYTYVDENCNVKTGNSSYTHNITPTWHSIISDDMELRLEVIGKKTVEDNNHKRACEITYEATIVNNNEYNHNRNIEVNYSNTISTPGRDDKDHAVISKGSNKDSVTFSILYYDKEKEYNLYADVTGRSASNENEVKSITAKIENFKVDFSDDFLISDGATVTSTITGKKLAIKENKRYYEVKYSILLDNTGYQNNDKKAELLCSDDNKNFTKIADIVSGTPYIYTVEYDKSKTYNKYFKVVGVNYKGELVEKKSDAVSIECVVPTGFILNEKVSVKRTDFSNELIVTTNKDGKPVRAVKYGFKFELDNKEHYADKTLNEGYNPDIIVSVTDLDGNKLVPDEIVKEKESYECVLTKEQNVVVTAKVEGWIKTDDTHYEVKSPGNPNVSNLNVNFPKNLLFSDDVEFDCEVTKGNHTSDYREQYMDFKFTYDDSEVAADPEGNYTYGSKAFYEVYNKGIVPTLEFEIYQNSKLVATVEGKKTVGKNEFTGSYLVDDESVYKVKPVFTYGKLKDKMWFDVTTSKKYDMPKAEIKTSKDYQFGGTERVTITPVANSDKVDETGTTLTRTYSVELTNYNTKGNVSCGDKRSTLVVEIKATNGKEVVTNSVVFTASETKTVDLTYKLHGNYEIESVASGYEMYNKQPRPVDKRSMSASFEEPVQQKTQTATYEISVFDNGKWVPFTEETKVYYGQKIRVEDKSYRTDLANTRFLGEIDFKEIETKYPILKVESSDEHSVTFRVANMNSAKTTTLVLDKASYGFYKAAKQQKVVVPVEVAPVNVGFEIKKTTKIFNIKEVLVASTSVTLVSNDTERQAIFKNDDNFKITTKLLANAGKEFAEEEKLHNLPFSVNLWEGKGKEDTWVAFFSPSKGPYKIVTTVSYEAEDGYVCPYDLPQVREDEFNIEGVDASIQSNIEDNGTYSFRESFNLEKKIKDLKINGLVEDGFSLDVIEYKVEIGNTKVISFADSVNDFITAKSDNNGYITFKASKTDEVGFKIVGAGDTTIKISAVDKEGRYEISGNEYNICVENSSLLDEDYEIKLINKDSSESLVTIADIEKKCEDSNKWINSDVKISVSENGKAYYDLVAYNTKGEYVEENSKNPYIIGETTQVNDYRFWLVNSNANAKTNTTRTFTLGVDTVDPSITEFVYSKDMYDKTSSNTKQYYANNFEIKGKFEDTQSGIRYIKYTTDKGVHWKDVEGANLTTGEYKITLPNGEYSGVAVKAIDWAGNESDVEKTSIKYKDEYINIIVDSTSPIIELVKKNADFKDYDGQWTAKQISMKVVDNTPQQFETYKFAGVYQYQYQYVSIGSINGSYKNWQPSEKNWKKITSEDISIVIGDDNQTDKNGVYFFRAISNTGVVSESILRSRVQLQQNHAQIKPMIVSEISPNGEWYNKSTGVPALEFVYPDYEIKEAEYAAPVTVHVKVVAEKKNGTNKVVDTLIDGEYTIGFDNVEQFNQYLNAKSTKYWDDLSAANFDFKNKSTKEIEDGKYKVYYWITDATYTESQKLFAANIEPELFNVDVNAPAINEIVINGKNLLIDGTATITYNDYFNASVVGKVNPEYGISEKESLRIYVAKRLGDSAKSEYKSEEFTIAPNTRGIVCVEAVDGAGNKTVVHTSGIVVDRSAPEGISNSTLLLKPDGANSEGFYNKDIKVNVAIKDMPNAEDCSSLKSVILNLGKGKNITFTKTLFSAKRNSLTEEEIVSASKFEISEIIKAIENESNEAFVEIIAEDMSGNKNSAVVPLMIDVTKPVVNVTFDNMSARNVEYYKENRIATIHVTELNFDPARVKINISRDNREYQVAPSAWTHNQNEHYATIAFTEDGDYTLSVECTDRADNVAEVVTVEPFTVDKTDPVVTVTYNNNNAYKENYYNAGRIATITVREHNFDSRDFVLHMNQQVGLSAWTHNGDEHYATINCHEDGFYSFNYEFVDMAGSSISAVPNEEFYVDTTAPVVKITGVENESANQGEIAPSVTITDINSDIKGIETSLRTGRGDVVNVEMNAEQIEGGYKYDLTNLNGMDDNIYFLDVTGVDKAGNRTTVSYRYSLNRHGSSYDITSISKYVEKGYNRYLDIDDMEIVEMNVDLIDEVKIYISVNGEFIPSEEVNSRSEVVKDKACYSIKKTGNEQIGYTFQYVFYKENFEREGEYNIAIYSKDKAGNEVNSTLSDKFAKMHFVIDNTVPTVVIDGVEGNKMYNQESLDINVMISDNFKLSEAEFYTQDEMGNILARWNYLDLVSSEGQVVTITIPGHNGMQTLLYRAKDAAGNEITSIMDEDVPLAFFVTTDLRLRFMNSPVMKAVAFSILLLILLLIIAYILWKQRKRNTVNK